MSTWHQRQRPVKLWHDEKWTVVSDPPEQTLTLSTFSTYSGAQIHLDNLKHQGHGAHCYILPPGGLAYM